MLDSWIFTAVASGLCFLGIAASAAVDSALSGLPAARAQLAIDKKVRGHRSLLPWLRHPSRILSTLAFLRVSLILGAGFLTYDTLNRLDMHLPWPVLALCVSAGILIVCHVVPRFVGKMFPVEVATSTLWLVHGLAMLVSPIVWPVMAVAKAAARAFGLQQEHPFWTPEEVGRVLTDAHAEQLGERGEELFLSMIEFSDTVIREIMVPRTEMVTIPLTSSREEVDHTVQEAGHSRVPVYDETIDNIIGILHVKDLFLSQLRGTVMAARFNIRALVRPTFYVPEIMKISELLREFQRRKTHMAIVVDEYGGTAGVVTLEDIIEEIVGEIQDEYDVEEKQFRVLGDNKIIADGRVSIYDLEEALGVEFPNNHDYETLAGFLMARIGSLPETGMIITWDNLRFTVKEANEKRIGMVEIERRPKLEGAA